MERIELCRQVNLAVETRGWVGNKRLNPARRALLAGLRSAPLASWETLIPPLPAWSVDPLVRLSDDRANAVAGADATVIGEPDLLRWRGEGAGEEVGDPPTSIPTAAAAGAVEQALAGTLKALRRQRQAAPRAAETLDPLAGLSSRALVREVARRQIDRVRRSPR
jgi:hypothetical protein